MNRQSITDSLPRLLRAPMLLMLLMTMTLVIMMLWKKPIRWSNDDSMIYGRSLSVAVDQVAGDLHSHGLVVSISGSDGRPQWHETAALVALRRGRSSDGERRGWPALLPDTRPHTASLRRDAPIFAPIQQHLQPRPTHTRARAHTHTHCNGIAFGDRSSSAKLFSS